MHIILVSDRMATAKTITLTKRHGAAAGLALIGLVLLVSWLASFVALKHVDRIPLPYAQDLLLSLRQQEARKTQEVVRDNLNAMAVKLGEMQARIVRLDTLGERLAKLTGIKTETPADAAVPAAGGRGGPLVVLPPALTETDLQRQLEILALQLETRDDHFGLLETRLLDERVRLSLLPTTLPISGVEYGSDFGWRRDPFNGQRALHEGVDFSVDAGTPILAAAGGVVIAAEYHSAYGNVVEIDHGGDMTTRYAHASRILVKEGAVVKPGQKIAEVGSTGRSTGPHLHFEVRVKGVAQDPKRFLDAARSGPRLFAATTQ